MSGISKFIERKLFLKVNKEKIYMYNVADDNTSLYFSSSSPVTVTLVPKSAHYYNKYSVKQTLADLASGECDIVIGTHRLLQKDIKFKNLGLLVVDEEQRFGVTHKEHMKEMSKSVDVLTLSATPIPRTLNMALSGIRDMSTIEEPPADRYPVQTFVMEHNNAIIDDAIRREVERGGQVYYLYNRVESITSAAIKLKEALPEANIAVAHGQMGEDELSEVWRKLIAGEIDILVCTTIIETGVDVPNVNTLIIENADHLGLSQLYQLRGRVGRSSRHAFAYFTFTLSMRSPSRTLVSRYFLLSEISPLRYFSTRRDAMGAAHVAPNPPFSTYAATAIFGLSFGAKQMNTEWSSP